MDWVVDLGVYTGSDHNAIRFTVQDAGTGVSRGATLRMAGWVVRKLNEERLVEYIRRKKIEHAED